MADSTNQHQHPTGLNLYYVCEYLLKPDFWLLGAALIVYTIVNMDYIGECFKAEEEALATLPTHEPPRPAPLPDNTGEAAEITKEEAANNTEEAAHENKEEASDITKQEAADDTSEEESDPLQPHGQDSDPDPTPPEIQSLIALRDKGRLTRRCTRWLVPYLTTRWHRAFAAAIYLAILGAHLLEGYWMEATLYRIVTAMFRQSLLLAEAGNWLQTVLYVLSMVVLALSAAAGAWAGLILVTLQVRLVLEICFVIDNVAAGCEDR